MAAQLFITTSAGLRAGKPSEARVDEDGVLGRFIIDTLAGTGLSMSEVTGTREGAGKRVGSPDSMLKVFELGDPESRGVDG